MLREFRERVRNLFQEHYREIRIPKRSGKLRKIHIPSDELKMAQKARLEWLYATGIGPGPNVYGVRKKGLRDHVNAHVGRRYLVQMDLKDFYHQVSPEHITRCLTVYEGLAENVVNDFFWIPGTSYRLEDIPVYRSLYMLSFIPGDAVGRGGDTFSLPQGSPLSPALSNLAFKPAHLAIRYHLRTYGPSDVRYTRYSDNLAFSSNTENVSAHIKVIRKILRNHNFQENPKKTSVSRRSRRQSVCGVVTNVKSNFPLGKRREFRSRVDQMFKSATRGRVRSNGNLNPMAEEDWLDLVSEFKHVKGVLCYAMYVSPDYYKSQKQKLEVVEAILKSHGRI